MHVTSMFSVDMADRTDGAIFEERFKKERETGERERDRVKMYMTKCTKTSLCT